MTKSSNKLQAQINRKKYVVPPSIKLVERVIKKLKISEHQFEKTFGLYDGCISHVRTGFKNHLPAHCWHLFYEKITIQIIPKSLGRKKIRKNQSTTSPNTISKSPEISKSKPAPSSDNLLNTLIEPSSKKPLNKAD